MFSTFDVSIESRVEKTGLVGATISEMEVDMVFRGVCFGKLRLPEVRTSSSGADVNFYDQRIEILDMGAFKAFVEALMVEDSLVLSLKEGHCSIRALGLTSNVVYNKDVQLRGMKGPRVALAETTAMTNTMKVSNPSPLEIDHGISMFDIVNERGEVAAELKGRLCIVRGEFDSQMDISFNKGASVQGRAQLVGRGTSCQNWTNDTLKFIHTEVDVNPVFTSFL